MAESALKGLRVIELGGEEGAWCGKLLADLGAEVLKIEPPGGDRARRQPPFLGDQPGATRSLSFLYMNSGKQSVVLDLDSAADVDRLRSLLHSADVLVESLPPGRLASLGLSYEALSAANPGLIVSSITGFGQSGPHSRYKSTDIVAAAMGGALFSTGYADDPPVRLAGQQSFIVASTLAALGSLIALYHRRVCGRGQQVDISMQEAMLSASSIAGVGKWLDDGVIPRRYGAGLFAAVPSGVYPCRDGVVYIIVNRPKHWQTLARWVHEETGNEEILAPMFDGPSSARLPYRELLDLFIGELTRRYRAGDFYREGQRRHLAVTPLNDAQSVLRDPHLRERGFFVDVPLANSGYLTSPGAPYHLCATPCRVDKPAPEPGQHAAGLDDLLQRWQRRGGDEAMPPPRRAAGALSGLRVVEFTAGMAGPWIGRFLAWCGAEVIKVESPDFPDVTRLYVQPGAPEAGIAPELSPWFTDWNAGKKFVALDLQRAQATVLAKRLVAASDIVIDNNAVGVLDKLGLGFASLQALKPELILFASTGYGRTGPDASYISWGPNIETASGLARLSGFPWRDCTMTQFAYPDALSALYGLVAITSALDYRHRTGQGQVVGLSQLEATIASIGHLLLEAGANGREPEQLGNGSVRCAPEGCYPCAGDDSWCALTVDSLQGWTALCRVLDRADLAGDERFADAAARLAHRQALDSAIADSTRSWEASALMAALQAAGIAAGVVQNAEDQFLRDPHLRARGYFESVRHLVKGEVVAPGIPLGFSATPGRTADSGRSIGHDNRSVFCELLGLSADEYAACYAGGVIQRGS